MKRIPLRFQQLLSSHFVCSFYILLPLGGKVHDPSAHNGRRLYPINRFRSHARREAAKQSGTQAAGFSITSMKESRIVRRYVPHGTGDFHARGISRRRIFLGCSAVCAQFKAMLHSSVWIKKKYLLLSQAEPATLKPFLVA